MSEHEMTQEEKHARYCELRQRHDEMGENDEDIPDEELSEVERLFHELTGGILLIREIGTERIHYTANA